MANPTINVEVKDIGTDRVTKNLDRMTISARKAAGAAEALENKAARQRLQLTRVAESLKNLDQRLRLVGANVRAPELLGTIALQLKSVEKAAATGTLSVQQLSSKLEAVAKTSGRAGRAMKGWAAETKIAGAGAAEAGSKTGRFSEIMRDLETSTVLAIGPLSGLGSRIRALSVLFTRSAFGLAALFAGITAAIVSTGLLISGAIRAGREMEKFESRLNAVTGSAVLTAREIRKLSEIANRIGVDVRSTIDNFSTLAASTRGTGIEGARLRKVYEDLITGTTGLRLGTQETERLFTALSQAFSKGILRAEEFNQQIGDALPGSQKIAADAFKTTTQEFNKQLTAGKILTKDFIEPFAREIAKTFGSSGNQVNNLTIALNNLSSASFGFFTVLNDVFKITEITAAIMNFLADSIERITELISPAGLGIRQFVSEAESFISVSKRLGGAPSTQDIEEFKKESIQALKDIDKAILESQVKLEGQTLDPKFTLDRVLMGLGFGETPKELQSLIDLRGKVGELSAEINNLGVRAPDAISEVEEASKRLARELEKIQDLFDNAIERVGSLGNALRLTKIGDAVGGTFATNLADANAELRKFEDASLAAFAEKNKTSVRQMGIALAKLRTDAQNLEELTGLFSSTRTELEKFNIEVARLNHLTQEFPSHTDIVNRALGLQKRALLESTEGFQFAERTLTSFGDTLGNVFRGAENVLDEFRAFAKKVVDDLLDTFLRLGVINPLLNSIFGLKEGSGGNATLDVAGGILGFLGTAIGAGFGGGAGGGSLSFGGPRAQGGPVQPGKSFLVGEEGPEVFQPKSSGTIIPNGAGQAVTYNQIINISPGVPEAVRREVFALRPMLQRDALQAVSSARRLGPKVV